MDGTPIYDIAVPVIFVSYKLLYDHENSKPNSKFKSSVTNVYKVSPLVSLQDGHCILNQLWYVS